MQNTNSMRNAYPSLILSMKSVCLLLWCCQITFLVPAQKDPLDSKNNRGYIIQLGDTVPEFKLTDIEGIEYSNSSLLGTTYVLQFTASWCGVCRKEMPHLESAVWQKFKNNEFLLLGVDLDEPRETVAHFAQSVGITYPIAPDPDGTLFYSIAAAKSGVTRNVVVDKEGIIVFLTRLYEPEEFDTMVHTIEALLD
jgi:peroxiredoxin